MTAGGAVTAITVTYGERVGLCVATVQAALAAGAVSCIVVMNGLTQAVANELTAALTDSPVTFVVLATNEGSAGGFAAGLRAGAAETGADLLWVLDDDNVAQPEALRALIAARARLLASGGGTTDPAMLSFRPADAPQARMREGGDPSAVYGPAGSVLYFDAFSRRRRRPSAVRREPIQVPYGPYGGLLVSSATARALPGPRAEFHLYEDDTEYTWRLARARGLHLVFGSVIEDADGKWSGDSRESSGPARLLRAKDGRRRRFSVRNRVAFDVVRVRREGGSARFGINAAIYLAVLVGLAAKDRRWRDLLDVVRAAVAGVRMGRFLD